MDTDSNDVPDGESARKLYQEHLEKKREKCIQQLSAIMEQQVPDLISELDRLIQEGHFDVDDQKEDHLLKKEVPIPDKTTASSKDGIPYVKEPVCILFPTGSISTQSGLESFATKIREHLRQQSKLFLEVSNLLSLVVPKIQSGGAFGLLILSSFFMTLVAFMREAQSDLTLCQNFNVSRCNLITRIAKFPHCADARSALEQHDAAVRHQFEMHAQRVRMRYVLITDHYIKNRDMIHEPVPENPIHMY